MKLSEVKAYCTESLEIIKDCEFEFTYLIGKPQKENAKVISFVGSPKFVDGLYDYETAGVICTQAVYEAIKDTYKGGIAIAGNAKTAFFEIHNYLGAQYEVEEDTFIDLTANIHPRAIIAEKNVHIGRNAEIYAHVVIKEGTTIGDDVIIREGTVIGGPAFYYYGEGDGRKLVTSTGGVVIGNNVELHANCIVEKGVMFENTVIGDNSKIDNCVVVGHDTKIGKNCTIAGNALFAGGVSLSDDVFVGVSAAVSPNVEIGEKAKVSSGAVVTKNVPAGTHVSGNFAIEHSKFIQHIKSISK